MSIRPFHPFPVEDAFDAETTRLLGEIFDSICIPRHDSGRPDVVLEVIAKRIIEAAKRGERDPDRLRAAALNSDGPGKCADVEGRPARALPPLRQSRGRAREVFQSRSIHDRN